jgi:hypothetical protein
MQECDMLTVPESADLVGGNPKKWIVIGWFTPNYRPLAEKFAENLNEHLIPFHLYAKPNLGKEWNTTQKPKVVLEAMKEYPDKTLILMDVDMEILENIHPVTEFHGDVGIAMFARSMHKGRKIKHWLAVECSSRVVVFKPTTKAKRFVERWAQRIANSDFNHDEYNMMWAFLDSPDIRFSYIDERYSGREVNTLPGAIIVHHSAHDKQRRKERSAIKNFFRGVEKSLFRTGNTRKAKVAIGNGVLHGLKGE